MIRKKCSEIKGWSCSWYTAGVTAEMFQENDCLKVLAATPGQDVHVIVMEWLFTTLHEVLVEQSSTQQEKPVCHNHKN